MPGHSSRESEGLRVSSGSLGGLWARRLPSLLGPDARPVLFQGHSPALQPSVSWQRHSRPVPSRAAWSLSLGWAGIDTRMGLKPQDAASHPHLLWEDGTGRRQAPLKPKSHRSPEHRGDIKRGLGAAPARHQLRMPLFFVKALCKCCPRPPNSAP